jgi:hypothetical protein
LFLARGAAFHVGLDTVALVAVEPFAQQRLEFAR